MNIRHLLATTLLASGLLALTAGAARAETIRVAIGTQDTTINCATGGLLIRELNLLDKYLPHDGKYKDVKYDVQWKNFTSGAPITNEMVAGKLDFGIDGRLSRLVERRGASRRRASKSVFITVLSGSIEGSGNGIVVPDDSPIQLGRRPERQDDLGAVRLDRARHAVARGEGTRLGSRHRREHHHAGAGSGRQRAKGA